MTSPHSSPCLVDDLDAVEVGQIEVLADERTRTVKASLPRDHELIYPSVQAAWDRRDDGAAGNPAEP